MFIKEVCSLTGLTKKAISYYEKQGLIEVRKCNNGYREYSKEDIVLLNEISKHMNENMRNEINNMLNAKGTELEMYKKRLLDNIEMQNDKSLLKLINPFSKFKKRLMIFLIVVDTMIHLYLT